MTDNNSMGKCRVECDDELLDKLLHLKRYETPEAARMTRCRQNIMREIRQQSQRRRLVDLMEVRFPWFFAEPKYGIALLFVGFFGLQYLAVNARYAAEADPGIYIQPSAVVQDEGIPSVESRIALAPEDENYSRFPENPEDFTLLRTPQNANSYVKPVMVEFLREE